MQGENTYQNLYEIPACTICLQELNEGFGSLDCGHVFHVSCITQFFEYKGTCPNCQKRACAKEIRPIVFTLTKNDQAASSLKRVLAALTTSENKQVEGLLGQFEKSAKELNKYKQRSTQLEASIQQRDRQLATLRTELNQQKAANDALRRRIVEFVENQAKLTAKVSELQSDDIKLRRELDVFKANESEQVRWRHIKRVMTDKASGIIQYKVQLEKAMTPQEEISKALLDMLLMKNLETLKCKEKLQQYQKQVADKQIEINKIRGDLNITITQKKQEVEQKAQFARRYDELKIKYRSLVERYKAQTTSNQQIDNEDSHSRGIGTAVIKPQQNIFKPVQPLISLARPVPSTSFGGLGLKKKA